MRGRIRKFLITMGGRIIFCYHVLGENDFLRGRIIFCYQDPERWGENKFGSPKCKTVGA